MKRLITPLIISWICCFCGQAIAQPVREVYSQDTGLNTIALKVHSGYGVTINFIPSGERIKQVWIGDPSRFVFTSNGNCTPEKECTNATVLFIRKIKPINFPALTSSPDGSTQLTVITLNASGQQKQYQFQLIPATGKPAYTSLAIKPDSEKPKPLLVVKKPPRQVVPTTEVRRLEESSSPIARKPTTPVESVTKEPPQNQTQNQTNTTPDGTKKPNPETTTIKKPTIPVEPATKKPLQNQTNTTSGGSKKPVKPQRPVQRELELPKKTNLETAIANNETQSAKPNEQSTTSKPETIIATVIQNKPESESENNPKNNSNKASRLAVGSTVQRDDANALAYGLAVAVSKQEIKPRTTVWRKAQTAILLLRKGRGREEAVRRSGLSKEVFDQLIKWGKEG